MSTFGPAFSERIDGGRIRTQMDEVKEFMLRVKGAWWTLYEISKHLGCPEASASAQLRHLKKDRFGGYQLFKRRRNGKGTWEYLLLPPLPKAEQMVLIGGHDER